MRRIDIDIAKAHQLYLELKSIRRTIEALKEQGISIGASTLKDKFRAAGLALLKSGRPKSDSALSNAARQKRLRERRKKNRHEQS